VELLGLESPAPKPQRGDDARAKTPSVCAQEDLKELVTEFAYDKEYNTEGFDKKDVKKIIKAAVAKAKEDDLKTKADELNELQEIQETYS
jgi:hypothetical protein